MIHLDSGLVSLQLLFDMIKNYYQVLGLKEGATREEIKKAYKDYIKHFHPDLHKNSDFFKKRFQEVQEAYDYLMSVKGAGSTSRNNKKDDSSDNYGTGRRTQRPVYDYKHVKINYLRYLILGILSLGITVLLFVIFIMVLKIKVPNRLFVFIVILVYYILSRTNLIK